MSTQNLREKDRFLSEHEYISLEKPKNGILHRSQKEQVCYCFAINCYVIETGDNERQNKLKLQQIKLKYCGRNKNVERSLTVTSTTKLTFTLEQRENFFFFKDVRLVFRELSTELTSFSYAFVTSPDILFTISQFHTKPFNF